MSPTGIVALVQSVNLDGSQFLHLCSKGIRLNYMHVFKVPCKVEVHFSQLFLIYSPRVHNFTLFFESTRSYFS